MLKLPRSHCELHKARVLSVDKNSKLEFVITFISFLLYYLRILLFYLIFADSKAILYSKFHVTGDNIDISL